MALPEKSQGKNHFKSGNLLDSFGWKTCTRYVTDKIQLNKVIKTVEKKISGDLLFCA